MAKIKCIVEFGGVPKSNLYAIKAIFQHTGFGLHESRDLVMWATHSKDPAKVQMETKKSAIALATDLVKQGLTVNVFACSDPKVNRFNLVISKK